MPSMEFPAPYMMSIWTTSPRFGGSGNFVVLRVGLSIEATWPRSMIGSVSRVEMMQFLLVASICFMMEETFRKPNAFWIWFSVYDLLEFCDGKALSITRSGANCQNEPIWYVSGCAKML